MSYHKLLIANQQSHRLGADLAHSSHPCGFRLNLMLHLFSVLILIHEVSLCGCSLIPLSTKCILKYCAGLAAINSPAPRVAPPPPLLDHFFVAAYPATLPHQDMCGLMQGRWAQESEETRYEFRSYLSASLFDIADIAPLPAAWKPPHHSLRPPH